VVRRAGVVLTAGCHYSRSDGMQQDRMKTDSTNKGREQGRWQERNKRRGLRKK